MDPQSVQVIDPAAGPASFQAARERTEVHGVPMLTADPSLVAYLRAHETGQRFLFGAENASLAGPYLEGGLAVLPLRGFRANSPTIPVARLNQLRSDGGFRYVLMVDRPGSPYAKQQPDPWVFAHCEPVSRAAYDPRANGTPVHPWTPRLYDCDR